MNMNLKYISQSVAFMMKVKIYHDTDIINVLSELSVIISQII